MRFKETHEPTKLHVLGHWFYGGLANCHRLRDLDRATREEAAPGAGSREANGGRKRAGEKVASW